MCSIIYEESNMDVKNYNFLVSNLILSQTQDFTCNDIIRKLKEMFEDIGQELVNTVKRCLIRLRDDGFLSECEDTYTVVELEL